MRIMYISPYPPAKDGLSSYTHNLACHFRSEGCNVTIIGTRTSRSLNSDIISSIGFDIRPLYRCIKNAHPDVIHVQYTISSFGLTAIPLWILLSIVKLRLQTRVVITFHEVKRENELLGAFGELYYRIICRVADAVTVHTTEAARVLVDDCHISRQKTHCVPHPLYVDRSCDGLSSDIRKKYSLDNRRIALFFGYIHVDKGIDHLVSAFALARGRDWRMADTQLVIVGSVRPRSIGPLKVFERKDNKYRDRLHHMVKALGITDSVRFVPHVPDGEIVEWFSTACVVVLPYTNLEQSGVVNIALACGTPIIASRLGGLEEILSGTEALVEPGDENGLAKKLLVFLSNPVASKMLVDRYEGICRERTIGAVAWKLDAIYRGRA
jgi:glycosyltransferase involved in cell wall biosynthesis